MIEIEGHAIVSADDAIADANGRMPRALMNDADWRLFQAGLDRADVIVLGRLGHEAHGNPKGRLRMVVSSRAKGLERRADGWWWSPAAMPWDEAIARVLPGGGRVAVPGGRRVFDLFLGIGFDHFALTRAEAVTIPDGQRVFSACDRTSADACLAGAGLVAGPRRVIDPEGPVSVTVWSRGGAGRG